MKRGIKVEDLRLWLPSEGGDKVILDGISFEAPPGQITGLAGESGSGKTMTGLTICGLEPEGFRSSGAIWFGDTNLIDLSRRKMNAFRGVELSMIFQDPTASLHPMLTISGQLCDHMRYHLKLGKQQARTRAIELLDLVHVPDPAEALKKYPHQFSGGQLQRIAIASSLAANPQVLIADEPTTALDVTVQAGILRLLRELCDELQLAIILVTHDLGVMSALADTIAVMRLGKIIEHGDREQVILRPRHEYTKALIDALPLHTAPKVVAHASSERGETP